MSVYACVKLVFMCVCVYVAQCVCIWSVCVNVLELGEMLAILEKLIFTQHHPRTRTFIHSAH